MENNNNTADSQNDRNLQNSKKEYPGYSPESESKSQSTDHKADDNRLANKGPVRNPNYHDIDDKIQSGVNYSKQHSEEKMTEHNDDSNAERDINKQGGTENDTH